MENNGYININQALHGYNNGHALLASSVDLTSDTKRLILPISDMSGGSMQVGFETYLTGYPIKEENLYAIAKTWYAPEMKRPGCVWTHTLLIDFSDLPKINDLNALLFLFVRPENGEFESKSYSSAIKYKSNQIGEKFEEATNNFNDYSGLIRTILYSLYENYTNSVFIKGRSTKELEKIILAIWKQQWPRIRRNFSFCTGAISPRTFDGSLLDLQLVSPKLDTIYFNNDNIALIDINDSRTDLKNDWVSLAYESILHPNSDLVSFFNFFGSDLTPRRTAFKSLAKTFLYFQTRQPNAFECLKFIAEQFPSLKEANSLKNGIFGFLNSPFNRFLPKYDELTILHLFSTTKQYKSFDYHKLNLNERFLTYIDELTDIKIQFLKHLITQDLNPFGETILTELAILLESSDRLNLIWKDKSLSSVFINLNPKLSYDKRFWIENVSNQTEIIHSLQLITNSVKLNWHIIAGNLIELNSDIDLSIFNDYNIDITSLILNWLNNNPNGLINENWLNFLHRNPIEVMNWLEKQKEINDRTLFTLVKVLNPNSQLLLEYAPDLWINYLYDKTKSQQYKLPLDVHCFYLTMALNSAHEHYKLIFEASFEIVYFALANDSVSYLLWKDLELHTKQLSIWKNWDKCKKLINATVDHYLTVSWDIKTLTDKLSSSELRDKILNQYKKRK